MQNSNPNLQNDCTKCGKSKSWTSRSGTLTGWIFDLTNCNCDRLQAELDKAPIICANCNKTIISDKNASITQWIFRPQACTCERSHRSVEISGSTSAPSVVPEIVDDPDLTRQLALPERYSVIRSIGRGGAALVCLAQDKLLQRKVAVKIFLGQMDARQHVRFQIEAKIVSQLSHPHIVTILDFGVNFNGQPFMVLEYLDGKPLGQFIRELGPLSNEQAFAVFSGIASALDYAHNHGINHRDLKPDNIILQTTSSSQIVAKLIDFGLATSETDTGLTSEIGIAIAGTPAYMSPDQASGLPFDVRSEIYSFGCVLFESIGGQPPFSGETPLELLSSHCHKRPVSVLDLNPSADPELCQLIEKCLQKSPENRYESFTEIVSLLDRSHSVEDGNSVALEFLTENRRNDKFFFYFCIFLLPIVLTTAITYKSFVPEPKHSNGSKRMHPNIEKESKSHVSLVLGDLEDLTGSTEKKINQIVYVPQAEELVVHGDLDLKNSEQLLRFPQAKVLSFAGRDQHIDPKVFKIISQLTLKSLNLNHTDADDEIMRLISRMPSVESLNLQNTKIGDQGLAEIAKLRGLRNLDINHCLVSDSGIEKLSKIATLTKLSINGASQISSNGLSALRFLELARFSFCNSTPDDAAISAISQLKTKKLYLVSCGLDDRKAKLLTNKVVTDLFVDRNNIGITGLESMLKLSSVKTIKISGNTGLSHANVLSLKSRLHSTCRVILVDGF